MIQSGIQSMDLPGLIASAGSRVILHAAIYSPFATSRPHVEAIWKFLQRTDTQGMDVTSLPREISPWSERFLRILRDRSGSPHVERELSDSWLFLDRLKESFPDRVRIHELEAAPCFPAVIVDDTILIGHYANASIPAGKGVWVRLQADIQRLFNWYYSDVPEDASNADTAAYRIVEDCARAMHSGGNHERTE